MKILQVCSKVPFPPKDGGSVAMNALTEGLQQLGHQVTVLALRTPKHNIPDTEIDPGYRSSVNYRSVYVDTSVSITGALLNLFSGRSYNVSRFNSRKMHGELERILTSGNFDIVQLETLFVTPYIPTIRKYSRAKIVLRSHNVEHRIWEMLAGRSNNLLKRTYLYMLARRLRKYENRVLNLCDAVVPITKSDQDYFLQSGFPKPIYYAPFGVQPALFNVPATQQATPSVFHVGAMDWTPNTEGIKWLLNEVWPIVVKKSPDLLLHLAGRAMPAWVSDLKLKNVVVHGEVDSSIDFMKGHSIMVVPLHSGGGMRVKIVEGFALQKAIITTTVGVSGIDCKHGREVLVADGAEEFASAIISCAGSRNLCESIAKNGRLLAERAFNNHSICAGLSEFYQKL